jgi:hypothetical protein
MIAMLPGCRQLLSRHGQCCSPKRAKKDQKMDTSIFKDKKRIPGVKDLAEALGGTAHLWQALQDYVKLRFPDARPEWNYSGEKYGWSFRIKDKKRAIIYLLPRAGFFKVAFVFGKKATTAVMESRVATAIKTELAAARVYAEGRGVRIDIRDGSIIDDIKTLIDIKLAN